MTKEEMMIAFAQRKKEWIGMNRKYNTATPTIVPRRTQRHRVFFPDETYNLLMSELAQLDKEREEKIRSYSQRINPLAEQRRALIDIIDEDAEIQQNEHLAAIEEEKRLRLELIDKTKEYLSNRLTFMIRQRELIEEREFYRTETVCLQEDLSALLNQNKTTAPQRKQQYNEQLLLHLEHLRLMTSAIEEKTRDMLFWHEKRTVPMWKKKIRSVDARVKQWKKKEKEIRRRWKNDRVGLDTEAKRIQRRIQQLIMRDGKISESESDDDDNDDGQTYSN
ncbi:MAG: hypothetical protein EZS28_015967 [Streblomastix strix]|uniref:Uncharacterized protein n=1 Tax=Streblomastix strix TaxID=222440 RepID=A0A5J4W101_9EUKA|nr:MAG: hypothetical protein EZS28_015967 [Streblomastix strix]